ncbi:MAG TPA: indolepyruvate ferredoxin oxidoreductase family protein [Burkholderiaceae bacterium]|nr:indolepyruvate ferredoxin oxidoreductase family protein [Burkholderiaceae bacterium]
MEETKFRSDYQLSDNLLASEGQVFLTGTQALVRLPLMQRALDVAHGLNTAGFISGYRGSPLGMVDQALWQARDILDHHQVRFLPAINEELGATAVLGSQQVESDPQRTVDAVFAYWYGKGPGVDRAGDALKHGNAFGSSPTGGVLIVAGDDHGCVSSSMSHQSDIAFQAWGVPTVSPANVAEYLEFGLYGWALSRFSGAWVGFTALSEVIESGMTVDLDDTQAHVAAWKSARQVRQETGYEAPDDGLHYRSQDPPSPKIEIRMQHKLDAARAFARINSIDRRVIDAPHAIVGIVTCGKAHYDLIEVFRRLGLSLDDLAAAGVRLYKVGLSFPIEQTRMVDFARGLGQILVVEEKAPIVETQMRDLFYNSPHGVRPVITGKHDIAGKPQISAIGELRPSRLIESVANWLARHNPALDRRRQVVDFTLPSLLSNAADGVRRIPYFCSGCPHNTSTRVPEGSCAQAGIGCHFMASWMDRNTIRQIQMGGEGVDWAAHGQFSRMPHIFQNLGDGTYYHSGYLAIRQSIAAKSNITYKILYNDAVAMTGGQPVDGTLPVDAIARQVEAEGAKALAVVSDDIRKYDAIKHLFPAYTTFHDREELDAVQRRLREVKGVSVMIYQQTCAAVKRRRRKKGDMADPDLRLFINQAVCDGCGDCGVQSNCLSVTPVETEFGRKRMINQSSCNKDYSCAKGFCPSFVVVKGGALRKRTGVLREAGGNALAAHLDRLPLPAAHAWTGPYDLMVTGIGGTGIITVGALLAMAAHLEYKYSSVLDFMGFAQKGGAVLSFVRFAARREDLNQVRIDTQQADAFLACDLVVGASNDALQTVRHGRTRVVANIHETPIPEFLSNPDADLHMGALLEKMQHAAGKDRVETFDAQTLAEQFLGDTIGANILAMGYAWQRGLIPIGLPAMQRAIELNGVAVEMNRMAFNLGRLAAGNPQALQALLQGADAHDGSVTRTIDELIAHRIEHLRAYQDDAYAERYRVLIERVRQAERTAIGSGAKLRLTERVAFHFARLMAYKDEYEVARLYTDGAFQKQLAAQFEGDYTLEFRMAPPLLSRLGSAGEAPRKISYGGWMMHALRVLAKGRKLRGTRLDLFGRTEERRMERALIDNYERRMLELLPRLTPTNIETAIEFAGIPQQIRGFGHVKIASIALARERETVLLHRFDPLCYPEPQAGCGNGAGKFRSIPIARIDG